MIGRFPVIVHEDSWGGGGKKCSDSGQVDSSGTNLHYSGSSEKNRGS